MIHWPIGKEACPRAPAANSLRVRFGSSCGAEMLGATANLPKTSGHALLVGGDSCCDEPRRTLTAIGYHTEATADPYAAMLELCRRPLVYRAIVLSLQSIYRDELSVITTIRRRFPHVSIWLAHTDGRAAALAEAMRLGAEALISNDGIHPLGDESQVALPPRAMTFRPVPVAPAEEPEVEPAAALAGKTNESNGSANSFGNALERGFEKSNGRSPAVRAPEEPVLSAAELRALLGDEAT